jgi:hypothetical protein
MAQRIDDWYGNAQDGSWDGSGNEHEPVPFAEWHDGAVHYDFEPSSAEPAAPPAAMPPAAGPRTAPAHAADQVPRSGAWRAPEPTRLHATALRSAASAALRADPSVTPRELQRSLARGNVHVTRDEAGLALRQARSARLAATAAAARLPPTGAHPARARLAAPDGSGTSRRANLRSSRQHPRRGTSWTPPGPHCPSCGVTVNDQSGCRCS